MKAKDAVELMDEGKIDESIQILEECELLDPEEYTYPYEIAYAYVLKKDYEGAIKILKKTKKYQSANSQVYQMSGNCYSYLGKPDKAIKEYEEGMKRFPNAGNLYLERGNIYLAQENYNEAVKNYETGIEVDPMFPSNYYRLAELYLNSNNKLAGLIYGELFMNIERTTNRTIEISELLYNTYQASITLGEEESKIEFCDIVIDVRDITSEEIQLPFCAIFAKNFMIPVSNQKEFNLKTLTDIRSQFIENYFKEDSKKYPNVLFNYHKKLMENKLFEAYNYYLFQVGAANEFNTWLEHNEETYDAFVDWYILDENIIEITTENSYIN
jgi:tetratricopeptide (TPR) repeat protein